MKSLESLNMIDIFDKKGTLLYSLFPVTIRNVQLILVWLYLNTAVFTHEKPFKRKWLNYYIFLLFPSSSKHFSSDFPPKTFITAGKTDNLSIFFWQKWTLTMQKMTIRQGIFLSVPLRHSFMAFSTLKLFLSIRLQLRQDERMSKQVEINLDLWLCVHTLCVCMQHTALSFQRSKFSKSARHTSLQLLIKQLIPSIYSFQLKKVISIQFHWKS